MRAVMLSPAGGEGEAGFEEATEMRLSPEGVGARVISISCHQSSSTALLTPLSWNHFLSPNGTANSTFGCVSWIFRMLGCERWS